MLNPVPVVLSRLLRGFSAIQNHNALKQSLWKIPFLIVIWLVLNLLWVLPNVDIGPIVGVEFFFWFSLMTVRQFFIMITKKFITDLFCKWITEVAWVLNCLLVYCQLLLTPLIITIIINIIIINQYPVYSASLIGMTEQMVWENSPTYIMGHHRPQ